MASSLRPQKMKHGISKCLEIAQKNIFPIDRNLQFFFLDLICVPITDHWLIQQVLSSKFIRDRSQSQVTFMPVSLWQCLETGAKDIWGINSEKGFPSAARWCIASKQRVICYFSSVLPTSEVKIFMQILAKEKACWTVVWCSQWYIDDAILHLFLS